ncbi:TniQ family protein [bacterium]|nr:TniQ family protein [bacterium]
MSLNVSSRLRWPLHPPPDEHETLERWVGRLAVEYGVSLPVFYRQALGLAPQEFTLMRNNPPDEALHKLEVGTGVPLQDLRDMSAQRIFQRLVAELNRLNREEPEAFADLVRLSVRGTLTGQPMPPAPRAEASGGSRLI